ncbi:MAG: prolyl oligopeptidase family serine peptidase [Verrucomicrobiaceae bacterium]|nr:prolyl oligopeptidase family serine peptidase [Verrucomicrobiaceae bacterium]
MMTRLSPLLCLAGLLPLASLTQSQDAATDTAAVPVPGYPPEIREVRYPCPDGSDQPALFWASHEGAAPTEKKRPLLVALHTWSGNYRQAGGEVKYAEWCLQNDWIFLHPDFRGINNTPEALGSDLAIDDIRAAVEWAKTRSAVDETRIYAVGVSGGGHITQLLAGRTPEIWAGISTWCGISDIATWHAETTAAGRLNYAGHIERVLGGAPDASPDHTADARHRSPLTWLEHAASIPLDINHGIHDGRSGSVPFTHSLHAWNAVVPAADRIDPDLIARFYDTQRPPAGGDEDIADPLYGALPPVYRKTSGNTRVTIFEGGHEILHEAALNWLAAQRKGQAANWNPPRVATLKTSVGDRESGK